MDNRSARYCSPEEIEAAFKEKVMALQTVLFCSQKEIEARPAWPHWAVISIVGSLCEPVVLKGEWDRVLRLEFDDIDFEEDPYQIFTEQHARDIIQFVQEGVKDGKIEGVLVHCKAGISRSAAVAKWIAGRYLLPFPDSYALYNKHVHFTLRSEHMIIGY